MISGLQLPMERMFSISLSSFEMLNCWICRELGLRFWFFRLKIVFVTFTSRLLIREGNSWMFLPEVKLRFFLGYLFEGVVGVPLFKKFGFSLSVHRFLKIVN